MVAIIAKNDYIFNDELDFSKILPRHRVELYYPNIVLSKPVFFAAYSKKLSDKQRKAIETFWISKAIIETALSKELYWYFGIIEINPFYRVPVFSFENISSYNSNWFEFRTLELSRKERLLRELLFINRNKS